MWSLPDINRLNEEAVKNSAKLVRMVRAKKPAEPCAHQGADCKGQTRGTLWYDIFSDEPKGALWLCEGHDGYYGSPDEGFFYCSGCDRTFIENYTWEVYYHLDPDACEMECLGCYAKRIIADPGNWITLSKKNIAALDFGQVRAAKHIFAVSGPRYGLIDHGGATFDNMGGGTVTGSGSTGPSDLGLVELREALQKAKGAGNKKALLILDGGYQFAVSIAVYAKK